MAFLAFMIILFVAALGVFGFGIYKALNVVKSPTPLATNYVSEVKKLGYLTLGSTVAATLGFIFLAMWQEYAMNAGEWVELIFGSALFVSGLCSFVYAFMIHYYAKEVPEKLNKIIFYSLIGSAVLVLVGLLLLTNGIADHIPYPLVNGISFKQGFVTPLSVDEEFNTVKPNIAWYALCILTGAILVYVICDHRFYVEYGKHGILESTFFVAFPAGIIGARIGYVIGEWNNTSNGLSFAQRVANGEWWSPLAIWEGGLTVISGALIGIVVGVAWFIWRNRKYSIWLAVDIIVPCILVAQALGRWGNFFNCEVHGYEVVKANWWFLPKIIANNAMYSESSGFASPGYIYMPLFYIEFLSNMIGYFVLRFAVGKGLRKYLELGDLAFGYLVWYGLTRVIMEPLRDTAYNMGQDGYYSWVWSICFVLIGTGAIFFNHLVRHIIHSIKKESEFKNTSVLLSSIVTGALFAGSLALIIIGAGKMANNAQDATIKFDAFNNGLIILVVGLAVLLIFGCSVLYFVRTLKNHKHAEA